MRIRGITKGDYDHIVGVLDHWWGGPSGQKAHPMFFHEFGDQALIADEGEEIVGFLLGFVAATDPPVGYIHLVGIRPDRRRRGVGQRLYARFIEGCAGKGVRHFKAIATLGHEGSAEFHRALGFEVREDPDYAGIGRARLVFTKVL